MNADQKYPRRIVIAPCHDLRQKVTVVVKSFEEVLNAQRARYEILEDLGEVKAWQIPIYKDMKKGDKILLYGKIGVLLSDPAYKTTRSSGLYYADVQWADGVVDRDFMICLTALQWQSCCCKEVEA